MWKKAKKKVIYYSRRLLLGIRPNGPSLPFPDPSHSPHYSINSDGKEAEEDVTQFIVVYLCGQPYNLNKFLKSLGVLHVQFILLPLALYSLGLPTIIPTDTLLLQHSTSLYIPSLLTLSLSLCCCHNHFRHYRKA